MPNADPLLARPDYGDRIANMTERAADFADLPDARARLLALGASVVGFGADPAPDRQPNYWHDIVCPEHKDLPAHRLYRNMRDWDIKSSCALVGRSHLRRLGARGVELGLDKDGERHPYMDQMAVQNIYVHAGTKSPRVPGKAWVVAGAEPPPEGVLCLIGEGPSEHVLLTEKVDPVSATIVSIDGGQVTEAVIPGTVPPKRFQCILRRRRSWIVRGQRLYLDGREIHGWLDPNLLALPAPATYDLV